MAIRRKDRIPEVLYQTIPNHQRQSLEKGFAGGFESR